MAIESVVVRCCSLPSSADHHQGSERLGATASSCRKLWSTIRRLWSVVAHPIRHLCRLVISHVESEIVGLLAGGKIPKNPITYIVLLALLLYRCSKVLLTWIRRKPIVSWEQIFVVSCIAVSLDTFFFYIPIINEEHKCIGADIKLRNTLLVLRSLTDFATLLHILSQVRDFKSMEDQNPDSHTDTDSYFDSERPPTSYLLRKLKSMKEGIHERMPWLSVSLIIDVLALLPIPQVAIIIVFFKMGGSNFDLKRAILNVFLILQYVPRICQIYLSTKKVKKIGIWVKGVFNFFLYLLAGHVLASLWYFFSIQRETACWHQNCRNCVSTYECGRLSSTVPTNISLLNELCPINSPNATLFDFGIYLDLLQSGNTGEIEFPKKFVYSLWWGIRNLSNFGTNLETSSYVWENCFAILIGIFGLLLFLYLIGNVQTYIQRATTKSVEIEERADEIRRKRIAEKYKEIKKWMSSKGLPTDLKKELRECCKQDAVAEHYIDTPVDVEFLHRVTNLDVKESILKYFFLNSAAKKVLFKDNIRYSGIWVDFTSRRMRAVTYNENSYIVRAGERCEDVVFIIEGEVELIDPLCDGSDITTRSTKLLKKGDHYGDELLNWASLNIARGIRTYKDCSDAPISTRDVKCRTKVEAFSLNDIETFIFLRDTEPTVPHDNTDDTSNQIDMESETIRSEDIEESKQMEMKNMEVDQGREEPKESAAHAFKGESSSSTIEQRLEQIIQLQGDMLRGQQLLALQMHDDMASQERRLESLEAQGRRLDEMAAFLATLGYSGGGVLPPPAP